LSISGGLIRLFVDGAASGRQTFRFPRTVPTRSGDKYVWTSSSAGRTILIETDFAPRSSCARFGPEAVRVVMDGREFRGCGGREILVTAD
jgi:hypothetical protein